MTTTTTYRDFNADLPEEGIFAVDTAAPGLSPRCQITMGNGEDTLHTVLSRDVAHSMGTALLQTVANPAANGMREFVGQNGYAVRLYADDGIWVSLNTDDDADLYVEFGLSADYATDLGQRLVAFDRQMTCGGQPLATDRAERDACQKGTTGCCVDHPSGTETDCETW